ncbi:histidine kinase [[Limnothrix rosea] IAM M-220]|uniref:histidine kinase n=1 Tax=[Limnothrix rosea] IAM M-220 TaxID=454133 RepID=UPI00095AFB47|nr:histidine kinase [[Limnothrix rosea] IAM M-220]OKH14672.1 histidine kinase [[Limnothrix rosea] IAM M-220]
MTTTLSIPDELAEKANVLAKTLGVSLDELSVMALEALLKKYERSSDADLDFEQKMAIAQRGIRKYQEALIELAK